MELEQSANPGLRGVLLLGLTGLTVIGQLYVSLPLTPMVSYAFPEARDTGLLGAAFGGAYAAGFLLLPPLIGDVPLRRTLVTALAVLAPLTLLAAAAPTWPWLVAARVGQGLAASAFTPAVLSFLAGHTPPRQRVRAAGIVGACYLLSVVAAQLAGEFGGHVLGWRGFFTTTSALYGLGALAVKVRLPRSGCESSPQTASHPAQVGPTGYGPLLRQAAQSDMRVLLAISATALFGLVSLYAALARVHTGTLLLWRLAAAPALLLAWPASRLAGRYGAREMVQVGLAVCAGGEATVTIGAVTHAPSAGLLIGIEITAVGVSIIIPALIECVRVADTTGAGPPLYLFALFTGATIAPWLALPTPVLGIALAATHVLGGTVLLLTRARFGASALSR
ncbi:major facilitator superfamily MFS_1 [Parafrankia sp. EAN1pec]|uniref:MFS transporter n=1 Tax=Parafrankia sp. (strain EAN1pec) TaxID=298653 RepID=UPI0000543C9E|nr:major facilitator superfamily MFS_1 [Frankia sp. EAN1pec]